MKKKRILITAALPYANGPLHFGHIAGAYLPADCFTRFTRLFGHECLFICGSDEYGIAITMSAEMAKRSNQEHVDIYHFLNRSFFQKLNISFDHYSRTTCKKHIPIVQQFFLDLLANGYIEKKTEDHLYSEEEKRFLADRYVMGTCPMCGFQEARGDECPKCAASYEAKDLKNPISRLTKKKLIFKKSTHWYLRFDLFKEKLLHWVKNKPWKSSVMNLTLSYIDNLKPRGITRDSSWGVPVPLDEAKDKVFYVWFDAPIGYISATQEWAELTGEENLWKKFWLDPKTELVHFLGKDNIPFHTVFFPAMMMGQNQPFILPKDVPANEFFLLEGRQFSKTDRWTIDLEDFFSKYSVDQIRYYLAANAPETSDSEFTWKDFQQRCNSELVGKLGNFVHRTLVFIHKNCNGKIPAIGQMSEMDEQFLKEMEKKIFESAQNFEHYQLRKASQTLMELATLSNVYFDQKKPWVLIKDLSKKEELNTTLALCLFAIKTLALMASPIIPDAAEEMWKMLGMQGSLEKMNWREVATSSLPHGEMLGVPKTLFSKIEDEQIEKELLALKGREK